MENCVRRAPYGQWSSESILLQGRIMSPECICLYCVQVRKEGSYFPCLAGMQVVESKTHFTPTQGGWNSPAGSQSRIWGLPASLFVPRRLHNALAVSRTSSQIHRDGSRDQTCCPYSQQSWLAHSPGGLSVVKGPPHIKHTRQICTAGINTLETE